MKYTYRRNLQSIAMAALVLASLCAVSVSVSASPGANQAPASVGASVGVAGAPAVCAQNANSLDLFVRGTDNALWWKHSTDGTSWGLAKSLGGVLTSDPAAVSTAPGTMTVFVRGSDGSLWRKHTIDGGANWGSWSKIGGQLLAGTGPAAYNWGTSRIGYFVTGTDHALWHQWIQGEFSAWEKDGGYLTSSPAATSQANGKIDVFVRGSDGAVWHKTYNNGWLSWVSRGGKIPANAGPAACSWDGTYAEGTGLQVFVQGTDGALWHRSYDTIAQKWTNWLSLSGILTSPPAAVSQQPGLNHFVNVFVRGSDNGVWQKTYVNGDWKSWGSVGAI